MGIPEHISVDLKYSVEPFLKKIDFFDENLMVVLSDEIRFGPCCLCMHILAKDCSN